MRHKCLRVQNPKPELQERMLLFRPKNRGKQQFYSLSCKIRFKLQGNSRFAGRERAVIDPKQYICKKYWTRLHNDAKMNLYFTQNLSITFLLQIEGGKSHG
jgi:hypothetical protein